MFELFFISKSGKSFVLYLRFKSIFFLLSYNKNFYFRCSRVHLKYENSPTVMVQNFFQDARLAMPVLNEKNNDAGLEVRNIM